MTHAFHQNDLLKNKSQNNQQFIMCHKNEKSEKKNKKTKKQDSKILRKTTLTLYFTHNKESITSLHQLNNIFLF